MTARARSSPARRPPPAELARVLHRLARSYGRGYVETDPVREVHRYTDPADQEIVGFLTAALAYGRVAGIFRSVEQVAGTLLGKHPSRAIAALDPEAASKALSGFRHRFTTGEDVALLVHLLRQAIERAGSLRAFFLAGFDPAASDIGPALASFAGRLFSLDPRPVLPRREIPRGSGARFLVPSPESGSACKRMCMFLRWMVRGPDGVDLGLWKEVRPAQLVIPLDTHLSRISYRLGLASSPSPSWSRALEVTASLGLIDPEDPTRFDFALSRLGIVEGCPAHPDPAKCEACAVAALCGRQEA